jgi:hypothetical protein
MAQGQGQPKCPLVSLHGPSQREFPRPRMSLHISIYTLEGFLFFFNTNCSEINREKDYFVLFMTEEAKNTTKIH